MACLRGGGGTSLDKPFRYVYFAPFKSENGYIDFAHFGLEAGMVFEGTTGAFECIYCFNSK